MVVCWHHLLLLNVIFSIASSLETEYDPRLEEFVWFETEFQDSFKLQIEVSNKRLQDNLKQKLKEQKDTTSDKSEEKFLSLNHEDEIFARYFFQNRYL